MNAVLQIKGISKSYMKGNEKFQVLKNVNLEVMEGEILCILGPSGCGKSTLLRQIGGFDEHDEGVILLDGKKVNKPGPDCVLIFQDLNQLLPWKTVVQNITFPMKLNKIGSSKSERINIAMQYLNLVKLGDSGKSYPYQLSGGMKQRAAIARALALNPRVLIMDEPFGNLDALTRNAMQELLLRVWKETGVTIVFVTHDIQEAIILSDRIVVMGEKQSNIEKIILNTLRRPRTVTQKQFSNMFDNIYELL